MQDPKIMRIPAKNVGTHETIVIVVDGVPQSVNTWNYTEDAGGNRVYYITGITDWQLHIRADSMVSVIR